MSKTVTMLKGLPASGKSTWAKEQVAQSQGGTKRVNKDDLRTMIDNGKYSKGNERLILEFRDMLITYALESGKHVIVDDTNLAPKHEDTLRALVAKHNDNYNDNVTVEVKVFDTSVDECIKRDKKRAGSTHVGADVILKMARQWSPCGKDYQMPVPELDMEALSKNGLPWCVIYDLDGTAAILGDRSPYDASHCDEVDRPNVPLLCILKFIAKIGSHEVDQDGRYTMIAMSGRSSEYRDATKRFLAKHRFPCDALYMRTEGDSRKDAIIKSELYEAHIKGQYNVLVVFDDRDCMVKFWRQEIGIPCFQVNYGDF